MFTPTMFTRRRDMSKRVLSDLLFRVVLETHTSGPELHCVLTCTFDFPTNIMELWALDSSNLKRNPCISII